MALRAETPTKIYNSTYFEPGRWEAFTVRPDDIVVATPYKAGTTWTQNIVLHLIFQDLELRDIGAYSPWLEIRFRDFDDIRTRLEAQTHRRVIKSHLPFDGLMFYPDLKYIFVARHPLDIFMSSWNFYRNFGEMFFEPPADPAIPALPRPPESILVYYDGWISRGFVEGENDGYPFWSCLHQIQSWWDQRHRPNILFLHYADLLADLRGQIARVATFLDIDVTPGTLDAITDLCTFGSMKSHAATIDPNSEGNLAGGANAFFNKGTSGRWQPVLDDRRLAAYEARAGIVMDADCKAWAENGGPVPGR